MIGKRSFLKETSSPAANAFKIAACYFVLASIWIIASDLDVLVNFPGIANSEITQWQTAKGMLFVSVTSLILYELSRRFLKSIEVSNQALSRSEQHLRLALDNIPSTFVIYDADLRFQYVNNTAVQVSGLTREDMLGHRDDELFSPESTQDYLPLLKLARDTRTVQTAECKVVLPSGPTAYAVVTYVPLLDGNGEIDQILGATHNTTDTEAR